MGGMVYLYGIPIFQYYYWAANVRAVLYWRQQDLNVPDWVTMEKFAWSKCGIVSLYYLYIDNHFSSLEQLM